MNMFINTIHTTPLHHCFTQYQIVNWHGVDATVKKIIVGEEISYVLALPGDNETEVTELELLKENPQPVTTEG